MMTVKEAVKMHPSIYVFHLMWDGERKVAYLPGDDFYEQIFGDYKVASVEVVMEERSMNAELRLAAMPIV